MTTNGLMVSVYRAADMPDCTNGGVTAKHNKALLLVANGPFAESNDLPSLELRTRRVAGRDWLYATPKGEERWVMFGGNFVYSSDSRFAALNNGAPIPVHDRIETQDMGE